MIRSMTPTLSLWNPKKKKKLIKFVYFATISTFTASPALALQTELEPTQSQNKESQSNSWHITMLCKEGRLKDAMDVLHRMDIRRIPPDSYTYASLLQECINTKNVAEGKCVQAHMIEHGFFPDIYLTTKLVVMYAKFGLLLDARQLFDKMPERNSVSWTSVITGYAQHGNGEEAVIFFNEMRKAGMNQDEFTFASVLKACAGLGDPDLGTQVHQCMIKAGLESNIFVGSALVDMYVKCHSIEDAHNIFDEMSQRDVVLWTTMIAGFAQHGRGEDSLAYFEQMLCAGVKPNHFTFASVLMACSCLAALETGRQIHGWLVKSGLLLYVVLGNVLIDMYCKCDSVDDACQVFEEMPQRNKVSWNSLVAGYAMHNHGMEALKLFCQMCRSEMEVDPFTFASILRACASLANERQGKQVHASIIKSGFELHDVLGSALIDMYAKCGNMEYARFIFDEISSDKLVSGNAMITAYAQHGLGVDALEIFCWVQRAGLKSDAFTFASVLQACAGVAEFDLGKQIHAQIIRTGFESYIVFGNSLIDMYAKSGSIEDARQVFDEMRTRNVVSWTVIIAGYGKHGYGKEAVQLFERMQEMGIKVDHITLLAVLFACSHAGLVDEGWHYFQSMSRDHFISPKAEHYGCMIDLLGRAGHLNEAYDFIMKMPLEPNATMWGSLLGACINHVDTKLGRIVAEHLFELDPQNAGNYVALSNIYATAAKWQEASEVRKMMKERGIVKEPGRSWIVVNKRVHEFIARDRDQPHMEEIYSAWGSLIAKMKEAGYVSLCVA